MKKGLFFPLILFLVFFVNFSFTSPVLATESSNSFVYPSLGVNIPTVSFSKILISGDYLEVNFLGEYITGLYKYLLAISGILAVLMLMIGGIQYVVSPGGGEMGAAKKRITSALTGMVLLFCTYLVLFIINPDLVLFKGLSIQTIPSMPFVAEDDSVTGSIATSLGSIYGDNIGGSGVNKIPTELISDIQAAASTLATKGLSMSIASSFRSVDSQIALINQNCQNPPGSSTCNPKPGRPPTCILKNMDGANCPHTTGRALDIWGVQSGKQCVRLGACLKDMKSCFANPCQYELIKAMRAQGFCVLSNEAWHFEKPKMSSTCN